MTQSEALMFGKGEKKVKVAVVVAVERGLLHKRLQENAHGDVRLLLQRVLHVSSEKLAENRLVVVFDEGKRQDVENIRRARVRFGSKLIEQPEQRHVGRKLQLELRIAAALQMDG